jgi:N-carbamoylputrescine amidase
MSKLTVATTQFACSWDLKRNLDQAEQLVRAAANILPVVAANRVGCEQATTDAGLAMAFYGSSFICNHKGKLLAEADRDSTGVLVQSLDLAAMREERLSWGIYRDRRPEMYGPLLTLDGKTTHPRWLTQGI